MCCQGSFDFYHIIDNDYQNLGYSYLVETTQLDSAVILFKDFVKRKALKWTHQREYIVRTFLSTEEHVSVEDMLSMLRRQGYLMGQATVYRNMKLLAHCNIAEEKRFDDGRVRYDQSFGHVHHEHIICVRCRKVIEFVDQQLEDKKAKIAIDHGFKMLWHRLEIFGVCPECQSKENPST